MKYVFDICGYIVRNKNRAPLCIAYQSDFLNTTEVLYGWRKWATTSISDHLATWAQ